MSHFTVMVIGDNPEEQLAPFHQFECTGVDDQYIQDVDETEDVLSSYENYKDEYPTVLDYVKDYYGREVVPFGEEPDVEGEHKYGYVSLNEDGTVNKVINRTNPDYKWDWYQLGGRWSGAFIKLKEGATGFLGERSLVAGNEAGVDQAYLKDIDFDAIEKEARDSANRQYSEVASLFDNNTIPRLEILWKDMFKEGSEYKDLPVEKKREIYHSQEALKIAREKISNPFFELEKYQCSQEEFVEREVSRSFSPFAIVKDGEWFEKGEMGWFAIVSNEKHQEDWDKEVLEMIKELPEDTLISFFDCHI